MIDKKSIEVTYADTDMMGVVYHANYLVYFEIGRNSFFKSLGYKVMDSLETGVVYPIAHIDITYKTPVKYGDDVFVTTQLKDFKKTRTRYLQKVYANDMLCCEAIITLAHVDAKTFKPVNIEKKLPDVYQKYMEVYNGE